MTSTDDREFKFSVTPAERGERLDIFLSRKDVFVTRSQVKRAVEKGQILVNDIEVKPGHRLKNGDMILVHKKEPEECDIAPEEIPLDIIYEDAHILVVNKSHGMVVHPAAGNRRGTLVNALLFHCGDLSGIGGVKRPGIVHRLDKNTSGLMVVAKSDEAHIGLSKQFKEHLVKKTYRVLVHGDMKEEEGTIDLPIGRHPVDRKKMSTKSKRGKESLTRWSVEERYNVITLLSVRIETGRTHQIRVHLNAIGHPVVGDAVYGNSKRTIEMIRDTVQQVVLKKIRRQALHSSELCFTHPIAGNLVEFSSPLPDDMAWVCGALRASARKYNDVL
ncbi:MAG: RluA family pseudouridine synthase [Deltaproteobacteria bacterium]|nr:RluA family pseudouridine synthase [Deltaproteobacteria bacterium]MBW2594382.1 RluA family pseudouridine synthase [Deltaproteobacteria bacterium]MBW2650040.1 RluA family pseudouridine synthase [Deltaproteobacteria bacterium]